MKRLGSVAVVVASVGLLFVSSSLRADTIIHSADSGYALVPIVGDIYREGCEVCMFRIADESRDGRPDQRWVLVKTRNGFLIKSAESGLALVPVDETRNENFGKLCLAKVQGEGEEYQRWRFVKTTHGYLIQNVGTGLSLVPYRDKVSTNGGGLCLFRVEEESREGRPDQNWRLMTFGPVR